MIGITSRTISHPKSLQNFAGDSWRSGVLENIQKLCSHDTEEVWKVSRRGEGEGKARRVPETSSLKALEELCRLYLNTGFHIRSDGGKEFDNNEVNDFFVKNDISWIKASKPCDNPFAEMSSPSIV